MKLHDIPKSFRTRAVVNLLIFFYFGLICLLQLVLAGGPSGRFTKLDFKVFLKAIDSTTALVLFGSAFLLFGLMSLLGHQAQSSRAKIEERDLKEALLGEMSSMLLSASSFSLVGSLFLFYARSNSEGFAVLAAWPILLGSAFLMRPKSLD